MNITAEVTGGKGIERQLRKQAAIFASARGEVFVKGARNVRILFRHIHGDPAKNLPSRNPAFTHEEDVSKVTRPLVSGANRVLARAGRSTWSRAMGSATSEMRQSMRGNIAPASAVNTMHVGRHASVGTTIATGRPMKPLKPATIARKGRARPILYDTGRMWKSFDSRVVSD